MTYQGLAIRGAGAAMALGLVMSGVLAAGTQAAAAAPQPAAGVAPTVSELTVTATREVAELTVTAKIACLGPDKSPERARRPRVVSTFPDKGAVVRPGLLVVRVTFDQPMTCEGALAAAPPLQNPCPGASRTMLLSFDRRTVRTVCMVEPGAQYGLWVSQDPAAHSFVGLGGLPSEAYRLSFSTSAEPAVATVCDALAEDAATARQIRQRRKLDCSRPPPAPEG